MEYGTKGIDLTTDNLIKISLTTFKGCDNVETKLAATATNIARVSSQQRQKKKAIK